MQQIKGSFSFDGANSLGWVFPKSKRLVFFARLSSKKLFGVQNFIQESCIKHFYLLYKPQATLQRSSTMEILEQGAAWLFAWGRWLTVWLGILQVPQSTVNTFGTPGPILLRLRGLQNNYTCFLWEKIIEIRGDSILKAQSCKKLLNKR